LKGIKTFHDKQKLKQCMTTKPPIQKILKEILLREDENKYNNVSLGTNLKRRSDK
jgi:hypothetical protein